MRAQLRAVVFLGEDYLPEGKKGGGGKPEDQGRANTAFRPPQKKQTEEQKWRRKKWGEREEKQKQSIARLKISIRGAR